MIFGTIETSKAGRAAEFCDVDPESARLELRIITKGGARCEQYLDTQSLVLVVFASHADGFRDRGDREDRQEELRYEPQQALVRCDAQRHQQVASDRDHVALRARVLRLLDPDGEGRRGVRRCVSLSRSSLDGAQRRLQPRGLLADARSLRRAQHHRRPRLDVPSRRGRGVQQHLPRVPHGQRHRVLPQRTPGHPQRTRRRPGRGLRARR